MPVAALASPGIDVRRDEAAHLAVLFLAPRAREMQSCVEVRLQLGGIGMVSAAGVGGGREPSRSDELRLAPGFAPPGSADPRETAPRRDRDSLSHDWKRDRTPISAEPRGDLSTVSARR